MKFLIVALCLLAAALAQNQQDQQKGIKVGLISKVVFSKNLSQTKHFGFGYNGYPLFGAGYHYPSHYPSQYPGNYYGGYGGYGGYYNPYQPSLYPGGYPPVLRNNKN